MIPNSIFHLPSGFLFPRHTSKRASSKPREEGPQRPLGPPRATDVGANLPVFVMREDGLVGRLAGWA